MGETVLKVGTNDLGVLPRNKNLDYPTLINAHSSYEKKTTLQITSDENNEYNIAESLIASIPTGNFYDQNVKIFEWQHAIDGSLIIESYTDKQVNLFADLKVARCLIRANGPLFIKGKLESKSTIAIEATISCAGTVLSQPPISTTASIGCARIISSVSIAIRLRYLRLVGVRNTSPSEMVGNSSGSAPAASTPRLTAASSSGKWR